jgi:toxin HigB-1
VDKHCQHFVDMCKLFGYIACVIKSFQSKELSTLWTNGKSRIDSRMHKRILIRLDTLDSVTTIEGINIQGYNFHPLRGFKPTRYSVHVNGPWCITFEFLDGHVHQVDFEQYH